MVQEVKQANDGVAWCLQSSRKCEENEDKKSCFGILVGVVAVVAVMRCFSDSTWQIYQANNPCADLQYVYFFFPRERETGQFSHVSMTLHVHCWTVE
jgi:hypothetical protein